MSLVECTTTINGGKVISLNRPSKLNALNLEMIECIRNNIMEACSFILLKSSSRHFCAGGDVLSLINNSDDEVQKFFKAEYTLDHLLYSSTISSRPSIVFWDGIVMGGGVGIGNPFRYRIVTERTTYAMPECQIGLFPDVGASFFLNASSNMPFWLATYIALSGMPLGAFDLIKYGLATHYVSHTKLAALEEAILLQTTESIANVIASEASEVPPKCKLTLSSETLDMIRTVFSMDSIAGMFEALKKKNDLDATKKILEKMESASPISLKLTLELMKRGRLKSHDVTSAFELDYQLAMNCCCDLNHTDFNTGVTSKLKEKNVAIPKWSYKSVQDVPDNLIQKYFEKKSCNNLFEKS